MSCICQALSAFLRCTTREKLETSANVCEPPTTTVSVVNNYELMVETCLETLWDVVENAGLRQIQEVVQDLGNSAKQTVFAIRDAWKPETKINPKGLTLEAIVQ